MANAFGKTAKRCFGAEMTYVFSPATDADNCKHSKLFAADENSDGYAKQSENIQ